MAKVQIAGFDIEVVEPVPGLKLVSALAHELTFEDGEQIAANPELAKLVKAQMVDEPVEQVGEAQLVIATPQPDTETREILKAFFEANPDIRVVSSFLSVSAFRDEFRGKVIGPVTTTETQRSAPAEKRIYRNRWSA
jgi:hypothetical protein